jgi:hypothetical protein
VVDFFNEVDEDLRAQETRDLARKYLPWAAGVVVAGLVVAGGFWGWQSWTRSEAAAASVAYDRGVQALERQDTAAADAAFTEAAGKSSTAYKALALMQRAALALRDGKRDAAVKLFDEAAKVGKGQPIIADGAALKAAYVLMDTSPYAAIEARLQPLTEEGRPYRPLALEALAMAKLANGKTAEARTQLVALSLLLDAPDGVRERSQATIQMIDSGAAAKLPAIAKAAAALPPAPPSQPNPLAQSGAAAQPPQAQAPQAPAGAPAQ